MPNQRSDLGWLLAVVFAGTTALFAWQYAGARSETATLRLDFDALKKEYDLMNERLEAQQTANVSLMQDTGRIQEQLSQAMEEIEALQTWINATATPDEETSPAPNEP